LRAFELATTNFERTSGLASLGKAPIRLGEDKAARATLDENPHVKDAYKRLVALLLRRDEPDETPRPANRLSSRGVGHARLLASRTLALAKLGRVEEARDFANLAPTDARAPRRVSKASPRSTRRSSSL
jgi:hypothetical protein